MAVTKIKPIRGTVNKALAYILDPQKTDDAFYVSSYGCAASDAAAKEFEWTRNLAIQQGMQMPKVLARHLIQSFDIGEVTPEEAHEVGKQLADEWLKGKYEYVIATHIDKGHCHNHIIFNSVNYVDFHAYRSNKRTYRELRQLSDEICKEHGLSVIPPSQNKGMDYKEYTEAKRGTSWKQKLKQTIDRLVITAKDYDDFLRLMQEAGYEIKPGKYISFRAEGQERFTRSKTIGENYTEERIKERIAGRTPRRSQRQTTPKGISLIGDIQERIRLIDSKGYEYKAKLTILKEAARTLNYLTENNLLQYADLEKKVEDVHSSYERTGKELKSVEARLREVQPLIKNISNYRDGVLLQSRLYPQNDDDVRKLYRSMVQSVIARCLGLPNLWKTNPTLTEIRPYWTTVQGSLHYTDYENGYAALSLMKGYGNYGHLEIGSASRCVGCGRLHDRRNSTHCGECEDMCVCKACGSVVPKNSGHFLDGDGFYCAECMQPCSCCGKLLPREALRPVLNRRGRTNQLCPACEEAELANCRTCAAHSCCKDLRGLLFCERSRYTQVELEEQYA